MSVEALRARIVTLDSEIERQKNLLGKLEEDKIRTLRQLNAALDPVAHLPLEISSEIFLQSLAASPGEAPGLPTRLLHICNAWTDIALSTARLWTTVPIHFPCGDECAEILSIWFQRARNRPLSVWISLRGTPNNWNDHVSDILWRHGEQLKHLEILDDDLEEDSECDDDEPIDLFGNTALISLPLLETLTIRCGRHQRFYRGRQILELLHQSPNIVEFVINDAVTVHDYGSEKLIVPTLRRLIIGLHTSRDDILGYLSLPALETLSLPMSSVTNADLLAFIQRSAAPIQHLILGWPFYVTAFAQLHDCLRRILSLTRFEMWHPDTNVVMALFAALADTSLLPNLHDLAIHIFPGDQSNILDSAWSTFVHALSNRHIDRLYIAPVNEYLPPDVLDSLQELVGAGANIHIGTDELNFLAA
ncbi:hypothetical protein MSAN_00435600 [Mycena sanguinolenta]|uniref:F-box domain-containing protein n=1 Tax=Mycena sanguinolenta TaxID=230812 RepID=A0A8H7DLD4_9AGAR|nr:hypothetical protein MSAN_00435600 [Mycena sanguinolenta]